MSLEAPLCSDAQLHMMKDAQTDNGILSLGADRSLFLSLLRSSWMAKLSQLRLVDAQAR